MDRKTVIGIALIVVIMIGWGIFMMPSKAEREKQKLQAKHYQDSVALVEKQKRELDSLEQLKAGQEKTIDTLALLEKDSTFSQLPDSIQQHKLDSLRDAQMGDTFGPFRSHGTGNTEFITVETEKFVLTFLNRGGQLHSAKLKGYQTYDKRYIEKVTDTLDLMIGKESGYNITLYAGGKEINTGDLYFTANQKNIEATGKETKRLEFRAYANNNPEQYIEFAYTFTGNQYMLDFDVTFRGLEKVIDPNQDALPLTWLLTAPSQEKTVTTERERSKIFYRTMDGDLKRFGSKKKKVETEVQWVSYKQQFFSAVLIAKEGFKKVPFDMEIAKYDDSETERNSFYLSELAIPYDYDASETFGMQMYLGPNHYNTMKKFDIGLEDQIDLGPVWVISIINKGVIAVFNFFQKLDLSYGLIILLLTLIIKLITSPVTYKTFVSSSKMRLLKPDIDELSKKYKPGEELQKQQAVMQLYKRAGVSPLSGCIPALLQMPILLAMFSFFPAAVELRQEGFLWAEDFSTYDSILQLPFKIPFYGSHVSLFTLLMTATTLIYTWMSSGQMAAGSGAQARQMKIMMYVMPIVFLGVLNNYSAALSYYYFLSNLVSILLMLIIRKFLIDEKKLHAVIEENKKRPVKKSKWQQRLEDMQKLREDQVRQQKNKGKGKK